MMEIVRTLYFICCVLMTMPTWGNPLQYTFPQFERVPPRELILSRSSRFVNLSTVVYPSDCDIKLISLSGSRGQLLNIIADNTQLSITSQSKSNTLEASFLFTNWQNYLDQRLAWIVTNSLGSVISRPFTLLKYYLRDFPIEEDERLSVLRGNNARIVCNLPESSPSPPPIMNFLLNGIKLNFDGSRSNYRIIFVKEDGKYGKMILLIPSIQEYDEGSYSCQAGYDNVYRQSTKRTQVIVNLSRNVVAPKLTHSSPQTIHVTEASNFTIYCIFQVAPPNEVSWYWDDSKNTPHIKPDSNLGTLTFNEVRYEDSGRSYTCMVASGGETRTFRILVNKRLKLLAAPRHTQINSFTKSVDLSCEIQAPRNQSVSPPAWIFNSTFLQNNNKYEITSTYLRIRHLNEATDLGIYQCYKEDLSTNDWVTAAASVTLSTTSVSNAADNIDRLHIELGPNFDTKMKKIYSQKGDMKHIKCSLAPSLTQSFHIKWVKVLRSRYLHGCEELAAVNKTKCLLTGPEILTIFNLGPNDLGYYICEIYDNDTKKLIGKDYFHLEFEPRNQNGLKSSPALISLLEVKNETDWLPLPRVIVTWRLATLPRSSLRVDHYRIEYTRLADPSQSSYVQLLRYAISETHFTLTDPDILLSNYYYKFRIIGRQLNESSIRSNWSSPIYIQRYSHKSLKLNSITISDSVNQNNPTLTANYAIKSTETSNSAQITLHCRTLTVTDMRLNASSWQSIMSRGEVFHRKYLNKSNFLNSKANGVVTSPFEGAISIPVVTAPFYMCFLSLKNGGNDPQNSLIQLSNIVTMTGSQPAPLVTAPPHRSSTINPAFLPDILLPQTPQPAPEEPAVSQRMTVLVLGSLAGVLFIVALLLISLYLWKRCSDKSSGRGCSSAETFKAVHSQPLTPIRYPTNHNPTNYDPAAGAYLSNYLIGHPHQDDPGGGYLDPIGVMNEQKQRLLNQSLAGQSDQASAIYSQVGSDSFDVGDQTEFVNVYAPCPPPYFDVAVPPQNYQDFYPMTSYHPGLVSTTLSHRGGVYDATPSPMRQSRPQLHSSPCHILPNRMTESPQMYRTVNSTMMDHHSPLPPSYLTNQKSQPIRRRYNNPHQNDVEDLHSRAVHPLPLPPPISNPPDPTFNNKKRQFKQLPKTGVTSVLSSNSVKNNPQLPLYSNPISDNNNLSNCHSAYSSNTSSNSATRTDLTTSCERV